MNSSHCAAATAGHAVTLITNKMDRKETGADCMARLGKNVGGQSKLYGDRASYFPSIDFLAVCYGCRRHRP